jgi:hypothetical protein
MPTWTQAYKEQAEMSAYGTNQPSDPKPTAIIRGIIDVINTDEYKSVWKPGDEISEEFIKLVAWAAHCLICGQWSHTTSEQVRAVTPRETPFDDPLWMVARTPESKAAVSKKLKERQEAKAKKSRPHPRGEGGNAAAVPQSGTAAKRQHLDTDAPETAAAEGAGMET